MDQLGNGERECHGGHGGRGQSGDALQRNQAVASKWMMDFDARTYGEDQTRERESGGAHVVASHGELTLGGAPRPWRRW